MTDNENSHEKNNSERSPSKLTGAIDNALILLDQYKPRAIENYKKPRLLPSLLDRCRQEVAKVKKPQAEPIRTIHHFASTGGTVITKCLSAMPNVIVLSEVDPLSSLQLKSQNVRFAPSDVIRLLQYNQRELPDSLIVELFQTTVGKLRELLERRGERLLIRDHNHSYYCTEQFKSERINLLKMLSSVFDTRSLVTVRHPLDSYLSLVATNWVHFEPKSIDEYAWRYLKFLDDHINLPIFKYEDFVDDPESEIKKMAEHLGLPYVEDFLDYMDIFKLTGDSGRSGKKISLRERRAVPDELQEQLLISEMFKTLCKKLDYELD
jgi:hypothetical protein